MEAFARRLAVTLVSNSGADESMIDKCAYGLSYIIIVAINTLVILVLGIVTGMLLPTVSAAVSAAILKAFSGGPHLSSPWRCIVFTACVALILGWLGSLLSVNLFFVALFFITSFTLTFRYAPVDSPAKPIPASRVTHFRNVSLLVVVLLSLLSAALYSSIPNIVGAALLGMLWQGLSLTPAGVWLYRETDRIMVPLIH